jgi:hypothetical protein
MKMDLLFGTPVNPREPKHATAFFNLINALMERVGPCGEFRIELGGVMGDRVGSDSVELASTGKTPSVKEYESVLLDDKVVAGSA